MLKLHLVQDKRKAAFVIKFAESPPLSPPLEKEGKVGGNPREKYRQHEHRKRCVAIETNFTNI